MATRKIKSKSGGKAKGRKPKDRKKKGNTKISIKKKLERKLLYDMEKYYAECISSEIVEGNYGEYLRLNFEVKEHETSVFEDGTDATGARIFANLSLPVAIGTKSHKFISAMLGKELSADTELDLDEELTGWKGFIYIKTNEDRTDDNGVPYQNVEKAVPKVARRKKASTKKTSTKKTTKKKKSKTSEETE